MANLVRFVFGLALSGPVWGGVIGYTDIPAPTLSSPQTVTIDFSGVGGTTPGTDSSYASGLTIDGVTFYGVVPGHGAYLFVRSSGPGIPESFLYGPPDGPPCWGGCFSDQPGSGIEVTLPAGVYSVAWDFANFYASGMNGQQYPIGLQVHFSSGSSYTNSYTGSVLPALGGPEHIAFASDVPITSFEITSGGYPTVGNFSFGFSPAQVPEPGSAGYALAGSGLLAFIAFRRLRRPDARRS